MQSRSPFNATGYQALLLLLLLLVTASSAQARGPAWVRIGAGVRSCELYAVNSWLSGAELDVDLNGGWVADLEIGTFTSDRDPFAFAVAYNYLRVAEIARTEAGHEHVELPAHSVMLRAFMQGGREPRRLLSPGVFGGFGLTLAQVAIVDQKFSEMDFSYEFGVLLESWVTETVALSFQGGFRSAWIDYDGVDFKVDYNGFFAGVGLKIAGR